MHSFHWAGRQGQFYHLWVSLWQPLTLTWPQVRQAESSIFSKVRNWAFSATRAHVDLSGAPYVVFRLLLRVAVSSGDVWTLCGAVGRAQKRSKGVIPPKRPLKRCFQAKKRQKMPPRVDAAGEQKRGKDTATKTNAVER